MLLRKYSIIMLVTFNSKGEYQLHMALGIVMVALHLHDSQRPFGHRHVNPTNAVLHRYEMGSLLTLLVMLWCGGFFYLNLCQSQNGWCEFCPEATYDRHAADSRPRRLARTGGRPAEVQPATSRELHLYEKAPLGDRRVADYIVYLFIYIYR